MVSREGSREGINVLYLFESRFLVPSTLFSFCFLRFSVDGGSWALPIVRLIPFRSPALKERPNERWGRAVEFSGFWLL